MKSWFQNVYTNRLSDSRMFLVRLPMVCSLNSLSGVTDQGHGSGVTDQGQGSRVRGHGSGSVCIRLACSCDSSSFVARCLNTKMFLSHQEVLKFLKVFLTCPFSQGASVGYLYELTRANIPEFIWAFKEEAKN